jgi:hypothetical protein
MKDVISVDELAKLFANRIGSPWGEGATYSHSQAEPEDENDKPKENGRLYSHLDDEDFELFVRDFKSEVYSLLISKLPEKKPDKTGETPEGTTFHKADGSWVTANDFGYNSAIDDMKAVLSEMFRSGDE